MPRKKRTDSLDYLPLHPLEARILLVLAEGESHGYRIVKEIEERDAGWTTIFPANLYRRLRALVAKGLIEEAGIEADEPGRTRRVFRITKLGLSVTREEARRLEALAKDFRTAGLGPSRGGDR